MLLIFTRKNNYCYCSYLLCNVKISNKYDYYIKIVNSSNLFTYEYTKHVCFNLQDTFLASKIKKIVLNLLNNFNFKQSQR